jgi:hypothetical protein
MSWRQPEEGLVVNYSYLWVREAKTGNDEGRKERPCAIVVARYNEEGRVRVRVLPITHAAPKDPNDAIEIPAVTKARLGLDAERSWIVLTEVNDFVWPGFDVRPVGDSGSPFYGPLPPSLFNEVIRRLRTIRVRIARRT